MVGSSAPSLDDEEEVVGVPVFEDKNQAEDASDQPKEPKTDKQEEPTTIDQEKKQNKRHRSDTSEE